MVKEKRAQFLAFLLILSLLIVGFVTFTNYMSFTNIEDSFLNQLIDNQLIKNQHSAREMQIYINNIQDEIETLSNFPLIGENDQCTQRGISIVNRTSARNSNGIIIVNYVGDVITSCSNVEGYEGFNFQNTDFFSIPKETRNLYTSNLITRGNEQQILISAPIFTEIAFDKQLFEGVVISIVEIDTLYNLFIHPFINENYYFLYNLDSEKTIIKSPELIGLNLSINPQLDSHLITEGKEDFLLTHWDVVVGNERWRLMYVTQLSNINQELVSIQRRHVFSVFFIITITSLVFFYIKSLYSKTQDIEAKLEKANMTLEKLGINIETEKSDKYFDTDIKLDSGKIYLLKDEENEAHELFISSLNKGYAGIGIIRENPENFKEKYNLEKTSFIWLSKNDDSLSETNVENLFQIIEEFIEKSEKAVILIDRLDYIILENEFQQVNRYISQLKDNIQKKDVIIIVNVNPSLIDEKNMEALTAETYDILGKELKKNIELSQMELNMLDFVNESNTKNKMVSYKDISGKFNITKPTTRSKISMLQAKGLITIEQRGRFKSIKITSSGRRIL